MKRRWPQWRQHLTVSQQYTLLRLSPYFNGAGLLKMGKLTWTYQAQPSPLSMVYTLRVTLRQDKSPKIHVLEPDLKALADGRDLPHVYCERPVSLCLYFPRTREWTASMSLADTIIPWSYLWLHYFEVWLASGEWNGGGRHPEKRNAR